MFFGVFLTEARPVDADEPEEHVLQKACFFRRSRLRLIWLEKRTVRDWYVIGDYYQTRDFFRPTFRPPPYPFVSGGTR